MTINQFANIVTIKEGKKKSISVAQVKEVIKIMREMLKTTGVDLYTIIRAI